MMLLPSRQVWLFSCARVFIMNCQPIQKFLVKVSGTDYESMFNRVFISSNNSKLLTPKPLKWGELQKSI